MAGGTRTTPDRRLAWGWVIEYLANFYEIDSETLEDLIEAAPNSLGKNAGEMFALRCLEDLFSDSDRLLNEGQSVGDDKNKISFDLSKNCEEVLQSILQETSNSELRRGGPELLKWDIHPFILHKQASMPKCALEKLKDAILEGMHPCASTLKECSGLVHTNGRSSFSLRIEKDNVVIADDSQNRTLSQHKRHRSELVHGSLAEDFHENQACMDDGDGLCSDAKRVKQDALFTEQPMDHILVPQCDTDLVAADSPERMVEGTEKEDHDMETEPQLGGMEESRPLENSQGLLQSPKADEVKHSQCETEVNTEGVSRDPRDQYILADEADKVEARTSNGACCSRTEQEAAVDRANDSNDLGDEPKSANTASSRGIHGKTSVEEEEDGKAHFSEDETTSVIDVDKMKSNFLSSQCPFGNDSLSIEEWTQQNLCVKCNKDGQLLFCSFAGCPLVVHENCLGASARFDEKGDFYCPFCTFSLANSEYVKAKEKASLARKELAAFFHKEHQKNVDTGILQNKEPSSSRQNRDVDERQTNQINNGVHVCEVNDYRFERKEAEKQQLEPLASHVAASLQGRNEDFDITRTTNHISVRDVVQESSSLGAVNVQSDEVVEEQIVVASKTLCAFIDLDTSDDEESKCTVSKYSLRYRKRETQHTSPAIPQLRRKQVLWTVEEEKILQEGVQKFSSADDKVIPWKKILDYGGSAFQNGRTSVDLKDKWRNMCRGSPKLR